MFRSLVFCALALAAAVLWAVWPKAGDAITAGKPAPEIAGQNWLNSRPLTIGDLRGRVVLVEFWTYG